MHSKLSPGDISFYIYLRRLILRNCYLCPKTRSKWSNGRSRSRRGGGIDVGGGLSDKTPLGKKSSQLTLLLASSVGASAGYKSKGDTGLNQKRRLTQNIGTMSDKI